MGSKESFLTNARRDFIQRTMLNIVTVTLAAAYASKFFTSFQIPVRVSLWIFAALTWLIGFFVKKET